MTVGSSGTDIRVPAPSGTGSQSLPAVSDSGDARWGSGDRPAHHVEAEAPVCAVDHDIVYRFMEIYRKEHSISIMARVLGVSRSGYYAWKTRPQSGRARTDELLKKEIASVHACHHGEYGAPRIHDALREQGWRVGRKRVARLMRELGIDGRPGGSRRARKR